MLLECWGQWSIIYAKNPKMKKQIEKTKQVYKTKSKEYYNFLDKASKDFITHKKLGLHKGNKDTFNIADKNGFEIREMADTNNNSNYSSIKKSNLKDDELSDTVLENDNKDIKSAKPVLFKDFENLETEIGKILEVFKNIEEFSAGMDKVMMIEVVGSTKNDRDKYLGEIEVSSEKCFGFLESPNIDAKMKDQYDWLRMKTDYKNIQKKLITFNSFIETFIGKKIQMDDFKIKLNKLNQDKTINFKLENYKKKIIQSDPEISLSDIKESKPVKKKEEFEFDLDIDEGEGEREEVGIEDPFDNFTSSKKSEKPEKPVTTTFSTDNDFANFEPTKKVLFILTDLYIHAQFLIFKCNFNFADFRRFR